MNRRLAEQQYRDAAGHFRRAVALRQDYADAYNNLGVAYKELALYPQAETAFLGALAQRDNDADTWFNLGLVRHLQGKNRAARQAYRCALERNPQYGQAAYNLGILLYEGEEYREAVAFFQQALQQEPDNPAIYNNLGLALTELGETQQAIAAFRRVLAIRSDSAEAMCNLGNVLMREEQFGMAADLYVQAKAVAPDFAKAFYNLGNCRSEEMRLVEAVQEYRAALEIDPALVEAHWNMSHVLLLLGEYAEGWREYRWRWRRKRAPKLDYPRPLWEGERAADCAVLVHAEQGRGDTLQFVRYLSEMRRRVGQVVVACDDSQVDLLAGAGLADRVVSLAQLDAAMADADFQVPLLNLPEIFHADAGMLAGSVPYLFAEPRRVEQLASLFAGQHDALKVGVVWQGNPAHERDRLRSCRPADLEALFSVEGVRFFSLQLPAPAEGVPAGLTDLSRHMTSFADTAALLAHLDLVISVDTAVAHLAGAMGKPVWTLLPFVPDWRWGAAGDTTSWYPTMRLYRQQRRKQWLPVIEEVARDLARLCRHDGELEDRSRPAPPTGTGRPFQARPEGAPPIYLGLASGENFGWGVCSRYLARELARKQRVTMLNGRDGSVADGQLPGTVVHALTGVDFFPLFPQARGRRNIGYTFFENELTANSFANARKYDLVLAGSSWCRERLLEKGIANCDVLIQGIDPQVFYPAEKEKEKGYFVLFSGGKFELRKGQDLVLKAFRILQDRYPDMILVTCWYNMWPQTMHLMASSSHIQYEYRGGRWRETMNHLYELNGIDPGRVITFPLVPNERQREIYLNTDVGLFPNRCEGGTNLVMMEYMACGKTVIATNATGQADVLTPDNCLPLNEVRSFHLVDANKRLVGRWVEPSLEELVAQIEYAYHHREELRVRGRAAAATMASSFTWEKSAAALMDFIRK